MADIRITGVLDPTDSRAVPENPLSYGGRWAKYFADHSGSDDLALYSNGGGHHVITSDDQGIGHPQQSHYYWTPQTFSGDMEIWGYMSSYLGWDDGASLSIGFVKDVSSVNGPWDGWHLRFNNTFAFVGWEIYKITNGSGSKVASGSTASIGDGPTSAGDLVLFRRVGSELQSWISYDDGSTWESRLNHTDSAFQTDMYLSVGVAVAAVTQYPGLYHIGGGVDNWMPEFIRRPWEHHGGKLAR